MSGMTMDRGPVVELTEYEAIRDTFLNRDLSRAIDRRSYADGNTGDGTVSTAHGRLHRARRKIENTQFRRELLIEYERVLFPPILSSICDRLLIRKRLDLAPVAPVLSVGLAAKRAGLDFDENSVEQLQALVDHVDAFSQGLGPGIVGQEDPAAAHARVMEALKNFERGFVRPSWERRSRLLEQPIGERPESLPDDILTKLLLHRDEPELELSDDSRIVREVATYLQGGTHSSAQTMMHALYFLFVLERDKPQMRDQILADRLFAQRWVQEALRLRPVAPRMRRKTEADTMVDGRSVPGGSIVALNIGVANRDPEVFGIDANDFNPDRRLDNTVPRWGLSFGMGAHQCPGRTAAAGLPVSDDVGADPEHLFGTVSVMVQELVSRGVRPDPDHDPADMGSGERPFDWSAFPVMFPGAPVIGASRERYQC